MEDVSLECQENLVSIIHHALRSGMNHIETAQMYSCSEIQIGAAGEQGGGRQGFDFVDQGCRE